MLRKLGLFVIVGVGITIMPAVADASPDFLPGAAGIGDPYYPGDGNGGYDVVHYHLDVTYDPATGELRGVADIEATATQDLAGFNLDLKGLEVRSVAVDLLSPWDDEGPGAPAAWAREGDELIVTPSAGVPAGETFYTHVEYGGTPVTNTETVDGFVRTQDGAVVMGEPHSAATWFPVNDHPSDKATYDVALTVPAGVEAVSNGALVGSSTSGGWTTWQWCANEPMASYLTMIAIGQFDLHSYRAKLRPRPGRVAFVDAVDPDLFKTTRFTGDTPHLMTSHMADQSYKRLTRTIAVPPEGDTTLGYEVFRDTELGYDSTFVEAARMVDGRATDDWTTLEDQNGHTTTDVPENCPDQQVDPPLVDALPIRRLRTNGQHGPMVGRHREQHRPGGSRRAGTVAGQPRRLRRRAGPDLDQLCQRQTSAGRRGLHRQCGGLDRRRQHLVRGRR